MSVTSKPMTSSAGDVLADVRRSTPWRALGVLASLVGFAFWLIGARYTILGAPKVLGLLFGLFRIDLAIELPVGWPLLALTIAAGAVFSLVEFGCRPRRSFFDRSILLGLVLFLLWFGANAGDASSTFFGVTTIAADSWPLTKWVAAQLWPALLETAFLTYFPELCMIAGMRWLIRGRF